MKKKKVFFIFKDLRQTTGLEEKRVKGTIREMITHKLVR